MANPRAATPPPKTAPSELQSTRRVRIGLAMKLTLRVALVAAAAIASAGWVAWESAVGGLEAELNRQGALAARIASAAPLESWLDKNSHLGDVLKGVGALDVWIVRGSSETVASASGGRNFRFTDAEVIRYDADRAVTIRGGRYGAGTGDPKEPARFFTHAIRDRNQNDASIGSATVVVSERGVNDARMALGSSILLACILGLGATLAVIFLAGKWLLQPLRHLVKDVETVAQGNLQHKTLVRSEDELGLLADTFNRMTRNLAETAALRAELTDRTEQADLVRDLQQRLRPAEIPASASLSFSSASLAASDISSDLYDQLVLPDGRVAVLMMTASERGVPAATILSMARVAFRMGARECKSPHGLLSLLNANLAPDLKRGMFVAALLAMIDPSTGQVVLASAGHRVPALHRLAAKGGLARRQTSGFAIGLDAGPLFAANLEEMTFELAPSDSLILVSEGAFDGLPREQGEEAERRVLQAVSAGARAGRDAAGLLKDLASLRAERAGSSDISVLSVRRADA